MADVFLDANINSVEQVTQCSIAVTTDSLHAAGGEFIIHENKTPLGLAIPFFHLFRPCGFIHDPQTPDRQSFQLGISTAATGVSHGPMPFDERNGKPK